MQRQVLEARLNRHDPEHPDVLISRHAIATLLKDQGRIDEAIAIYQDVLDIRTRVLGVYDPETRRTGRNLYALLKKHGDEQQLRAFHEQALQAMRREAELPDASVVLVHNWAWRLITVEFEDLRDPPLALQAAERAAAMVDRHDPSILNTLAAALIANGRKEDAISVLHEALTLLETVPEPYEGLTSNIQSQLDDLLGRVNPAPSN